MWQIGASGVEPEPGAWLLHLPLMVLRVSGQGVTPGRRVSNLKGRGRAASLFAFGSVYTIAHRKRTERTKRTNFKFFP